MFLLVQKHITFLKRCRDNNGSVNTIISSVNKARLDPQMSWHKRKTIVLKHMELHCFFVCFFLNMQVWPHQLWLQVQFWSDHVKPTTKYKMTNTSGETLTTNGPKISLKIICICAAHIYSQNITHAKPLREYWPNTVHPKITDWKQVLV